MLRRRVKETRSSVGAHHRSLRNWFLAREHFAYRQQIRWNAENKSKANCVTSLQSNHCRERTNRNESFICIVNRGKKNFFIGRNQLRINMSLPSADRRCGALHRSLTIPGSASRQGRSASTGSTCCSPTRGDGSSD